MTRPLFRQEHYSPKFWPITPPLELRSGCGVWRVLPGQSQATRSQSRPFSAEKQFAPFVPVWLCPFCPLLLSLSRKIPTLCERNAKRGEAHHPPDDSTSPSRSRRHPKHRRFPGHRRRLPITSSPFFLPPALPLFPLFNRPRRLVLLVFFPQNRLGLEIHPRTTTSSSFSHLIITHTHTQPQCSGKPSPGQRCGPADRPCGRRGPFRLRPRDQQRSSSQSVRPCHGPLDDGRQIPDVNSSANDRLQTNRWQEGVHRRYASDSRPVFSQPRLDTNSWHRVRDTNIQKTAGSALIQACEKAGATVPR